MEKNSMIIISAIDQNMIYNFIDLFVSITFGNSLLTKTTIFVYHQPALDQPWLDQPPFDHPLDQPELTAGIVLT